MNVKTNLAAKTLSGTLLAVLLSTSATAALGQTQAKDSGQAATSVGELIVTANKREEKIRDVAMAVSALTGSNLDLTQSVGFQDFSTQIPGFSIQSQSSGFNKLILRGQNTGSTGASVATVVDDIPFTFSTSKGDDAFITANIDTWDLQRIEVLRGPQGTLYGAAAEGGLIKYVTNQPNLHSSSEAIEVGGEHVDGGQSAASAKGMVNVPLLDGVAAVRVSSFYEGLPGYINNPLGGQQDVNSGFKYGGRITFLIKPTSDISLRLSAYSQGMKTNGNGAVDVVGAALTPHAPPSDQYSLANGLNQNAYNPSLTKNRFSYYDLTAAWDLKWATLTSLTSYGQINDHFTGDITSQNAAPGLTYGAYFGGPHGVLKSVWGGGDPIKIGQDQSEALSKYNEEVRLSSNPGGMLDWLAGVFYTREDTIFDQFYNVKDILTGKEVDTSLPVGADTDPVRFSETAGFADATYHFTPKFDVELGGRYTQSDQHATSTTYCCVLFSNTVTHGESKDSDFTYSFGPRYHIDDDVMVYGRIASGYRPGGPLFKPAVGLTEYHADHTTNYELGVKGEFFDKKVTADVDVYYIDWTQIQITTRLLGSNNVYYTSTGNAGTAKSQGVEWNFNASPVKGLTFGLVGAYIDAELTQDATSLGGKSGDALPYTPRWSTSLTVNYDWALPRGFQAFVGGAYSYIGTRYTDFATGSTSEDHSQLPSYETLNAQIGVTKANYTIELYAKNLTNARGITYYVNQGGYNQTGQANIIQPQTIGLFVSAKY